eukprot:TRINITY_DN2199_c0_g1_i1.p1 TRINITY_DN2199_c0_g1~~TRINITY_DN2199_c0_g1_i1.p1  ORF type:complete len:117 (+),score=8.58 TRINITY_DN2199_c0_g1_i1:26-376(+)
MDKAFWWKIGCLSTATAVTLGAFGAHSLKGRRDVALIKNWETAVLYHFIHSFGMLAVAMSPRTPKTAGYAFLGGTALFSGSLYAMTLTEQRWLGAITPVGGVMFIAGWIALGLTGF